MLETVIMVPIMINAHTYQTILPNSTNCWVSMSKQQRARSNVRRQDKFGKNRKNPENRQLGRTGNSCKNRKVTQTGKGSILRRLGRSGKSWTNPGKEKLRGGWSEAEKSGKSGKARKFQERERDQLCSEINGPERKNPEIGT